MTEHVQSVSQILNMGTEYSDSDADTYSTQNVGKDNCTVGTIELQRSIQTQNAPTAEAWDLS